MAARRHAEAAENPTPPSLDSEAHVDTGPSSAARADVSLPTILDRPVNTSAGCLDRLQDEVQSWCLSRGRRVRETRRSRLQVSCMEAFTAWKLFPSTSS